MSIDRVKFQDIVASQLPSFVKEDFPLLSEFLEQYYVSQETKGATLDLLQNIDKYVNVSNLTNLVSDAKLRTDIDSVAQDIVVEGNTEGFLDRNGLIKIGDEIIMYETKTFTTFQNCQRGFSGTSSYTSSIPDRLKFENSTVPDDHTSGDVVHNLNVLFLQEFFKKLKTQISPGFGNRDLKTNQKNFIINSDSFYKTKGTDLSYKILFKALFGETVDIIRPSQFLFSPSDASYNVTQDIVVKKDIGNPLDLQSLTLFQDSTDARGTVTHVSQIQYSGGEYYQLSIDYGYDRDINTDGSLYGYFKSNPKTKILTQVAAGSTIIDVDSTVSFPETGKLEILDIDNNEIEINYNGKSINQFLNVDPVPSVLDKKTDVRFSDYSYAYVGIGTDEEIRVKITSTLKELKVDPNSHLYEKNDTVHIQSLGIEDVSINSSEWLNNTKSHYDVQSIEVTDVLENKYSVTTYDTHHIRPGYNLLLSDDDSNIVPVDVTSITSENTFIVKSPLKLNVDNFWKVENQTLKVNSRKYSFLNKYIANVQDTYSNFDGDIVVASNSLPLYKDNPTDPYNKTLTFSGSSSPDGNDIIDFGVNHGFYTGDTVQYSAGRIVNTTTFPDGTSSTNITISQFDNLDESVYYVRTYNKTSIKLSKSRADLFKDKYVTFSGTVTDNVFTYFKFYQKPITPQGIFRKFTKSINQGFNPSTTLPGFNGMFINGVELLNYKSSDSVFYGPIRKLIVTNGGSGYDIINPPRFIISDPVGSGATGTVAVEGNLERIDITDSGFDFQNTPIVTINGGNPDIEAQAAVSLTQVIYEVDINTEFNGNLNLTNDQIGFSSFHKFKQDERVIYNSRGMKGVSGLSTNSSYFVDIVDNFTITLHNNTTDSRAGINTVTLGQFGLGIQSIKSAEKKNVVGSIIVTNPGSGFKNKERKIVSTGISTATNSFQIKNHGYETKEIIRYTSGSSAVSGIVESKDYYVRKIDDNSFSLSEVGVGGTVLNYFFDRNIIVDITSTGEGTFNYKPIVVSVNGVTGIDSRSGQSFQCQVQPVFRGSIDSIDLTNGGVEYGSSDILNFDRQPNFSFENGVLAQVEPVINNGKIVDVVVNNQGNSYTSPPNLIISGPGNYAELSPIIIDGKLIEVKVIRSGTDYVAGKTSITVENPGVNALVKFDINEWNVNLFRRNFDKINDDDGIVEENISGDSTQYCHIYTPRNLRENTYVLRNSGKKFYGIPDLQKLNGIEIDNTSHSPIVGWAYDSCPIYGPYGYTNPDGGIIKQMISGYELEVDTTNRPPIGIFPEGFFIEDYKFTNSGDLDIHNGRFCITPDYPEGVYAYFTTVETVVDGAKGGSQPFRKYKRPKFPYVIGDSFFAERNKFNYRSTSNQIDYDIQSDNCLRNTSTYNTNDKFSGYDYLFDSNKIKEQSINITGVSLGSLNEIGIFTGGRGYQVNDRLVFESEQDGIESGAQAKVSHIKGREIDTINVESTQIANIEFIKNNSNQYIGFGTEPHGLKNKDIVNINNLSSYYKGFGGIHQVGVRTETLVVTLGIGSTSTTGITTYFYASGLFDYPFIRPNDILGIGTEKVKVLNIDSETKRIRVLRAVEGTVGSAHTNKSVLRENPRKFAINVGSISTEKYFRINEEFYFDPSESVGVGTASGNGDGTTVTFRNPGVGASVIFIPTQSIYYENHGLKFNERVDYFINSGTSLQVWNGFTRDGYVNLTDYDTLYATPIDKNLIGISSHKVGLSTLTGEYVGVGTTSGLLYFNSIGTGDYHSFKTSRSDVLRGSATNNVVTVSTASTHGLLSNDKVRITVKPTYEQVVDVRYNDYNRRIVFNPVGFASDKVNTQLNSITISNHNFILGDKVIHTSDDPTGGLVDNKMYYVVPFDNNDIKLVTEKFEVTREEPKFVNITSGGNGGTISKINPLVVSRKNNNLKFDLSDSSLSFLSNGVSYPAFKMSAYLDQNFSKEFLTTGKKEDKSFEVTTSGIVGITSTANLTIELTDDVSSRLYYKFDPINKDFNFITKTGIVIDKDSLSPSNQINVELSNFDGEHTITGTSSTTFSYQLTKDPETTTYTKLNSVSSYITNSTKTYGEICKIDLINPGINYSRIPKVINIISGIGTNAILKPRSNNIGKIFRSKFDSDNIGFDYPTDQTLRPVANLPEILEMKSLNSFESIGISSIGRNYLSPAELVVIDGYTNTILPEVDLQYKLGDTQVKILNNTTGMYEIKPTIIPTQNSNGVGISTLSFDDPTKTVRLYLNQQFSTPREFPFVVGENILVENINIGTGSSGVGYNSVDYNYTLFPVTAVFPQLGGSGAYIEYSLFDVLESGEVPGTVQTGTVGRVIPETHFPIFDISLTTNDFFIGETVTSGQLSGIVKSWKSEFNELKLITPKEFSVGSIIRGESSNTQGVVINKWDFNAEITTGVGATVIRGWQDNIGFLNDNLQVIPNNEYYQRFSYSLSSRVPYQDWNGPVSDLNHTSGFAKFADYQLESIETEVGGAIITPNDSNIDVIVDIIGEGDLNCVYDFDFVSEGTQSVNGKLVSDEIFFENQILTDYFQSIGNRVLSIDDISGSFNSNERAERFESVSSYELDFIFNKVFTFTRDNVYTDERQFSIVNVLQDGITGYVNEYATIETYPRLGFYDYLITNNKWDLTFNPVKFEFNVYDVSTVAISLRDNIAGIGSTQMGDIVDFTSKQVTILGTETTIASFPITNRAAKVLTMVEAQAGINSGEYHAVEMNVIHDGTNVYNVEYGDVHTSLLTNSSGSLGTYRSFIDSGLVKINFIPDNAVTHEAQTSLTVFSGIGTTAGNIDMDVSTLKSTYTSIPSSGSPSAVSISTYTNPFSASYNVVVVTDTTNNDYEMFECVLCNSSTNETFVDYANVIIGSSTLGSVGVTSVGSVINLTYTPIAGANVEVRTFGIDLMIFDNNTNPNEIDNNNVIVSSNDDGYTGTKLELLTKFNLEHEGNDIFRRVFDGSDSNIVDVTNGTVAIPNHFFVTGEKILYTHNGSPIGIVTTTVSGISTDKLPNELYVVKIDDSRLKFTDTPEKANKLTNVSSNTFTINSVGIGNSHVFTATNQNAKALVAIDNMIQAPISGTAVTTSLDQDIVFETVFDVTGITSFASQDIVKIGDEYIIITDVGIAGSTRFGCRRAQLGSTLNQHSEGSLITKISGNYNIVDNVINFASAPYGKTPLSTTSASDPDSRDWTGIATSSSFQGRTFMRRSPGNSPNETYTNNIVFDDISHNFNGINTSFTLNYEGSSTVGYSTDNGIILINNIFQDPKGAILRSDGTYNIEESSGISTVGFAGTGVINGYDPNDSDIPLGGLIVSAGTVSGFGYQPLVAAGGTVSVSATGTITAVSIANSGSGYRAGIQTVVNVGVQTDREPSLHFIGTAAISGGHIVSVAITNPGTGYTGTNLPEVVFDDPLPYFDIPVQYSSSSVTGAGKSATVNIVVGQGSSIIDFEFRYGGYAYGEGEILTVPIGGTTGIPTDTSVTFEEFQISVNEIFTDNFNGWTIGQLEVLDKFDDLFDGSTRDFILNLNTKSIAIQAAPGSKVEVDQTLLIFINNILQEPGKGYVFNGGSTVEFTEPPKIGDTSKVLFYKGSGDIDVVFTNVIDTIKVGDTVDINNLPPSQSIIFDQDTRIVTGINTLDSVKTNVYQGPGVTSDRNLLRPITWCKQTVDKVIDGKVIGKDRTNYEPQIYPTSYLIQPISSGSTVAYVDNLRPLFDSNNESTVRDFQDSITITSQDNIVGASGTAIVSTAGTITSISITNAGLGYTVAPIVTIGSTLGVSTIATATAFITNDEVTSVTITNGGVGYTGSQVPTVLFESPTLKKEEIGVLSYEGDFGTIVGFGTNKSGSQNKMIFDLFIPYDSFIRDDEYVGSGITVSEIGIGDFLTIYDTNIDVGVALTTQDNSGNTLSIASTFSDAVYQVSSVSTVELTVSGISTYVRRIETNVSQFGTISFGSTTTGDFSWGKIFLNEISSSQDFNSYNLNGYTGISSSGLVQRTNPLKFFNYIQI